MSVTEILKQRFALSFEVSPTKTDAGMEKLCGPGGLLDQLYTLAPDGISCTYVPGGGSMGKNLTVLDKIVQDGKTLAMTRFSCAGNTEESARSQMQTYLDHGVRHVLLQQGGNLSGRRESIGELREVACLTEQLRRTFGSGITIGVEGLRDAPCALEQELAELKRAADHGADCIVTRLCWDMEKFYRWLDSVLAADIRMPIVAEVAPVVDQAAAIQSALVSNGGVMPEGLAQLVSRHWIYPNPFVKDPFDPEAERKKASFREAGRQYTAGQIRAYRACGIGGIHLRKTSGFDDLARILRDAQLR